MPMSFWCCSKVVERKETLAFMPAQGTQMSSLPEKSVMKVAKPFSRLSWLLTSTLGMVS
jgi:hypothetical protein